MNDDATPANVLLTDGLGLVGNRIGDVSDLPTGLRDKLSKRRTSGADAQILSVIRDFDGVAGIDEIMVGLWRKHKVLTEDRRALANRVYRLKLRGNLAIVSGRRGVFKMIT